MKGLNKSPLKWLINWFNFSSNDIPWWLEIETKIPQCIYYFGPFDSPQEAQNHQSGYIEDLINEKAEGISVKLKQIERPTLLTIDKDNFSA